MKKLGLLVMMMLALVACEDEQKDQAVKEVKKEKLPPVEKEYGFVLNDFEVLKDTIESGDSFGFIM
ncbi:MAG: M23 family peptidase, partial [Christiangramia sp.]